MLSRGKAVGSTRVSEIVLPVRSTIQILTVARSVVVLIECLIVAVGIAFDNQLF